MKILSIYNKVMVAAALVMLYGCSASVPKEFSENGKEAKIYPDYTGIEMPCNIAPMNFRLDEAADDVVLNISCGGQQVTINGKKGLELQMPEKEWKSLLQKCAGKDLKYDIYAKKDGKWEHYKSFTNHVSTDSIDHYLTYRLIEPSYMGSGELGIYQYNLETGEEKDIFTNHRDHIKGNNPQQKCLNCHTSQRNHPENKMFYYRGPNGGLLLTYKGEMHKINTRCGDMQAGTVYPSWHPSLPLIALSSNKVMQVFSSTDPEKLQAYDEWSDLVLYDIEKNEITPIRKTPNQQETNPCWSADGKALFFNSTDTVFTKSNDPRHMLYNVYRISFDPATKKWGENELIFEPAKNGKSATYPKASPDGKYLLITLADYGTSTQTTKSADLWMIELATKQARAMDEVNCVTESESYHDWSSNSKWIVFSSRREDGNYSRPYFSHIDKDGKGSKPFILPREDSRYHANLIKNYNVPEFSGSAVETSTNTIEKTIESNEKKATYNGPVSNTPIDANTGASKIK